MGDFVFSPVDNLLAKVYTASQDLLWGALLAPPSL